MTAQNTNKSAKSAKKPGSAVSGGTRAKTAKPKKRDREATTQKLLEAGLAVFSLHGYDKATTKLIAKKAGISEALIIRYFGSKEGLLHALFLSFMEKKEAHISSQTWTDGDSLQTNLYRWMTNQCGEDFKNQDFGRIILTQCMVNPKFHKKITENIQIDEMPMVKARCKQLQMFAKFPKSISLEDFSFILAAQNFGTMVMGNFLLGRERPELERVLNLFTRLISAGVEKLLEKETKER
jgi:AcrR family transcriptional regulator